VQAESVRATADCTTGQSRLCWPLWICSGRGHRWHNQHILPMVSQCYRNVSRTTISGDSGIGWWRDRQTSTGNDPPACNHTTFTERCMLIVIYLRRRYNIFSASNSSHDFWHYINLYVCMIWYQCFTPSVLWHCWLGGRKGIQPVKNWVVGCWHSYLSGAQCRLACGPADAIATHCLLLQ